jgi:ketosteroid isomerase-like protein
LSNATVVEEFIEALGAGDAAAGLPLLHPDVQIFVPARLPFGGEYAGLEGFIGFFEQVASTYDVKIHDAKVMNGGDHVVTLTDTTWTARATGASLDTQFCEVYTVTDDKITVINVFPKDTRALHELTIPMQ